MTAFLRFLTFSICLILCMPSAEAQRKMKFEQLGSLLPDPNIYRDATGSPGPAYWQQQVDYKIKCRLEVDEPRLFGEEEITYHNNSPSTLQYLWIQLDENQYRHDNEFNHSNSSTMRDVMSKKRMDRLNQFDKENKHGHTIESITSGGAALDYFINNTVLRISLPEPLKTGEKFTFNLKWNYFLTDRIKGIGDRGGYEYFEEEDNYIFVMTQWYPRLCAFTDYEGWQNNQFTGTAEFALQFGDFEVEITVPDDHVVGSTGECQNYSSVLNAEQNARFEKAKSSSEIIEIITLEEAVKNAKTEASTQNKTWVYKAKNVRDFAWTASKKFMWDAMNHKVNGENEVMCMSYYGEEAAPLWRKYSTKTVAHALDIYSDISVPYDYPVCISVEANNGMEYPMITFNDGRCEHDKTYSAGVKEETISTIIHEVGHQFFPMIVNSDERQWTWMDEGLNSYVELIACNAFDHDYNKEWVNPFQIADYMSLPQEELEPIMTNSENIIDFGSNCYDKPAAGLTLLRETIVGRELFDQAFKEYARRWAYKHPTPADFFRSIEDACGEDLDWFWKAWFFGTEPVDLAIDSVRLYTVDLKKDPKEKEKTIDVEFEEPFETISLKKNKEEGWETAVEKDPELVDFYNSYRPWERDELEVSYLRKMNLFSKEEKEELFGGKYYYEIEFRNKGGHPMALIIEWQYEDGSSELEILPAQVWRYDEKKFKKVFVKTKKLKSIQLDPNRETADINQENNKFEISEKMKTEKIRVYKDYERIGRTNGMQRSKEK